MQKIVRLFVVVAVLGFASWAAADYPTGPSGHYLCSALEGQDCDGGRLACDLGNGNDSGACTCTGEGVWDCIY